ncbi:hypothetical protein K438DRAFT_1780793 [Mycena galopus ATCC 62051]|nr:hypothetical protein K438DRAFT_1780793 [Mycena galopus ATCC 62051]
MYGWTMDEKPEWTSDVLMDAADARGGVSSAAEGEWRKQAVHGEARIVLDSATFPKGFGGGTSGTEDEKAGKGKHSRGKSNLNGLTRKFLFAVFAQRRRSSSGNRVMGRTGGGKGVGFVRSQMSCAGPRVYARGLDAGLALSWIWVISRFPFAQDFREPIRSPLLTNFLTLRNGNGLVGPPQSLLVVLEPYQLRMAGMVQTHQYSNDDGEFGFGRSKRIETDRELSVAVARSKHLGIENGGVIGGGNGGGNGGGTFRSPVVGAVNINRRNGMSRQSKLDHLPPLPPPTDAAILNCQTFTVFWLREHGPGATGGGGMIESVIENPETLPGDLKLFQSQEFTSTTVVVLHGDHDRSKFGRRPSNSLDVAIKCDQNSSTSLTTTMTKCVGTSRPLRGSPHAARGTAGTLGPRDHTSSDGMTPAPWARQPRAHDTHEPTTRLPVAVGGARRPAAPKVVRVRSPHAERCHYAPSTGLGRRTAATETQWGDDVITRAREYARADRNAWNGTRTRCKDVRWVGTTLAGSWRQYEGVL